MTDRLEELVEKLAEGQIEMQKVIKRMDKHMESQIATNKLLAETQASLAHLVNGLHDQVHIGEER